MCLRDDQDRLADVVEEDHAVVEGERKVGQPAVVGGDGGELLGVAHRVIGGEADGAAGEPRQTRRGRGAIPAEEPLELGEGIAAGEAPALALAARLDDPDLGPARLEPHERLGPEEAEPADLLSADDALEQEGRGRPLDPAEGRDRRQPVAGQLAVDRDARGRRVQAAGEVLERRAIAAHRHPIRRRIVEWPTQCMYITSRGGGPQDQGAVGRRWPVVP